MTKKSRLQGGQPVKGQARATFLSILCYSKAISYTWAHMNITPSLPHSHTHFYLICCEYHTTNKTMTELYKAFIVMHVI